MPYNRILQEINKSAGETLYLSERYSDVSLLVENGDCVHRYPAHSLFLRSVSEVISIMLDSDMSERSTKKIRITDSNAITIRQFLRYIYAGEVVISEWRELLGLLSIAHRYQVIPLVTICEKMLLETVTLSNVCILHDVAELYDLYDLQSKTEKLILDGAFIVIATDGFEMLCKQSVENLISNPLLNVENELSVLNALKKWAKSECSRRAQELSRENILATMQPILRQIRLKSIPQQNMKFIPLSAVHDHANITNDASRVKFFVSPTLHDYMASLKFILELGSFIIKPNNVDPLTCLKFSSETQIFIMGFRMLGMYRRNFSFGSGSPMLVLHKQNSGIPIARFSLSSLSWKEGALEGEYIWKELIAYFAQPVRVESHTAYSLSVKYGNLLPTKWPRTRVETNRLKTEIGTLTIHTLGPCSGITELLILPAPPVIEFCNDT